VYVNYAFDTHFFRTGKDATAVTFNMATSKVNTDGALSPRPL